MACKWVGYNRGWDLHLQVLGAGQLNGQFALFDTRRGVHAIDSTERHHRLPFSNGLE